MMYHSALKDEIKGLKSLDRYTNGDSMVLQHDINNGAAPEFFDCDCIYIEPAWRDGYNKFIDRSGEDSLPFESYLSNIKSIIKAINKPSFVIMGKHMIRELSPERVLSIKLHGYKCYVGVYNHNEEIKGSNNYELMQHLGHTFDKVLDFCCGYGNTMDHFKNYILSDINPKCVYFVAKKMGYGDID